MGIMIMSMKILTSHTHTHRPTELTQKDYKEQSIEGLLRRRLKLEST
jgi:hypothetical protein